MTDEKTVKGDVRDLWSVTTHTDADLGGSHKYEILAPTTSTRLPSLNKYALGCALLASFNSILLGYDTGIMSGAVLFIKEDLKISELQEELLVGSLSIVSLLGSVSAGRVADAVGRRWTMVVAQIFFIVGAVIMGVAPSFGVLMSGRVFAGIGVGFALMIAPVYTAEVSPASSRGSLVSLPEVFINFGILLGYICSYILSGMPENLGWRFMLGFGGAPAILLIFGSLIMPESPRWLVMKKRFEEAKKVLDRTCGNKAEADLRLAEIISAAGLTNPAEESRKSTWPGQGIIEEVPSKEHRDGRGVWRELLFPTPAVRQMLIVALGVQFFQQSTGIDATVYYSPAVLNGSGITSKSASIGATVAIGFCKTIFILVATFFLDQTGRRPLLLTSIIGMTVSLGILAIGFQSLGVTASDNVLPNGVADSPLGVPVVHGFAPILSVLALCFYVSFFSIGLGPVNWVITSEVFPSQLRAQAMGLGIVVNRMASGVVTLSFLSMVDAITLAGIFSLFTGMGFIGSIFIYFWVPETKGKTLEDIAKLFETQDHTQLISSLELGDVYPREFSTQEATPLSGDFSVEGEEVTLIAHDSLEMSIGVVQKELVGNNEGYNEPGHWPL